MDKPTCKSCPFWDDEKICRRYAPRQGTLIMPREIGELARMTTIFEARSSDEWCGDHPEFAAWIASQRPEPECEHLWANVQHGGFTIDPFGNQCATCGAKRKPSGGKDG